MQQQPQQVQQQPQQVQQQPQQQVAVPRATPPQAQGKAPSTPGQPQGPAAAPVASVPPIDQRQADEVLAAKQARETAINQLLSSSTAKADTGSMVASMADGYDYDDDDANAITPEEMDRLRNQDLVMPYGKDNILDCLRPALSNAASARPTPLPEAFLLMKGAQPPAPGSPSLTLDEMLALPTPAEPPKKEPVRGKSYGRKTNNMSAADFL